MTAPSHDALGADLPDVIPAWLLADVGGPAFGAGDRCSCRTEQPAAPVPGDTAGWAVPGVTGLGPAVRVVPPVSPSVAVLQDAVEAV